MEQGEHAIQVMENTEAPAPVVAGNMLEMLVQKDATVEMIEKIMDLRDREETRNAKNAYTEAMALFKANAPEIEKDAKVGYANQKGGHTSYTHATLGNVSNTINKALGEYGLSAAWQTEQSEKAVKVTCTITHKLGHSESTSLSAAPDTSGSKNAIQALGSTISYLERYTILALTGLATKEQDDDGKAGGEPADEFITPEQAKSINALLKSTDSKVDAFLKWLGAEEVATIPAKKFKMAMNELRKKVEQGKKEAK